MTIQGALQMSHVFMKDHYQVSVDATCGNGHDTLFLAEKSDKVYAFDIQKKAIIQTQKRINKMDNCSLFQCSFVEIPRIVQEEIDCVIFNLGYLPGDNKVITTTTKDLQEILQVLPFRLAKNGRIFIVSYPGHEEGKNETEFLKIFLKKLDSKQFSSFHFYHMNGESSPAELYIIQRNAR